MLPKVPPLHLVAAVGLHLGWRGVEKNSGTNSEEGGERMLRVKGLKPMSTCSAKGIISLAHLVELRIHKPKVPSSLPHPGTEKNPKNFSG